MLNDHEGNDALAVALERQITPGSRVLDIGSGTALLAMMAIRAGAAQVELGPAKAYTGASAPRRLSHAP